MIFEELGDRTCLGDINASIIPVWDWLLLGSPFSGNFSKVVFLNGDALDDVGERWSEKSWVVEVDDEGGVFQKEGIDSIMLLYLHKK